MSRPDLQEKLLKRFEDMHRAAEATAKGSPNIDGYILHRGRSTAFRDCIRELEKSIEESK